MSRVEGEEYYYVPPFSKVVSTVQHEPNKNFNSLQQAYLIMNVDNGVSSIINSSDDIIFKQRTPSENTVLHIAAKYGNDTMVEKVAEYAPQLFTAVNRNLDTALHVAARMGHVSTSQLILNKFLLFVRQQIVERKTRGETVDRDQSLVEMMLLVSLTMFRNDRENTFLHEAFITSSRIGTKIFKAFDESSPLITVDQFDGELFNRIVKYLAPFAVNKEQKSLLYLTVEVNCQQVVNKLIDVCKQYGQEVIGRSPFLPALINKNLGMLDFILDKKPDWVHLRDDQGRFPLHHAALLGYQKGVDTLVQKCPSCTLEVDKRGNLPIQLACQGGHVKIVRTLLLKCQWPHPTEMVSDAGRNLLHTACKYGSYEVVRYLLKHPKCEMMINQKDRDGNTPLHLASRYYHAKIVHALTWDNRVNISLLNNANQTALDIAEESGKGATPLSKRLTGIALKSAGTPRSSSKTKRPRSGWKITESSCNEEYKDRTDTMILVSTLIITTSLAAGFAVPGGIDEGTPVLLKCHLFAFFILSLTISVFGSISSTIILMWARVAGDLDLSVFAVRWALRLLGLSLMTLSLAFLAGTYLIVSKLSWLAITFLVIGSVLVLMIMFLYTLLLMLTISTLPFFRYISYYPFLFFASIAEGQKNATKMGSKGTVPVL